MFQELTVGERLKMVRKAKKLLQEDMGAFINVGKSQISNIEKGYAELTRPNAIVLCEQLGIELDWLLTGEGRSPGFLGGGNSGNINTNTQTVSGVGNLRAGSEATSSRVEKINSLLERELEELKLRYNKLEDRYDKLEERYERVESERDKLKEDNSNMALELSKLRHSKE